MKYYPHVLSLTLFAVALGAGCAKSASPPAANTTRTASKANRAATEPMTAGASPTATPTPPYRHTTAGAPADPDRAVYRATPATQGGVTPNPAPSPFSPSGSALNGNVASAAPAGSAARTSSGSRPSPRRRTPVPPDIQKLIQQKIDRLEEGQILFNPPTEMRVGVKERVEVRISREAEADIREGLEGRGEVTIEPIRVDSYMRVKLTGNNFNIEPDPKQEEEQMVRADDYTQWAWDVTPESSGTQKLYVRVAVKATLPEIGEKTIYAQILEKPVVVRVHPYYSTAYFCKKNWQWLLGTIAGSGVLGFSLGRRGKKG